MKPDPALIQLDTLNQQFIGCLTVMQFALAPLIASHKDRDQVLDRLRQVQQQGGATLHAGQVAAGIFAGHIMEQVQKEIAAMK